MKTQIVILVLIGFFSIANGQPKTKKGNKNAPHSLRFGIRMGIGLAAFNGKVIQGLQNLPVLQFTAGGTVEYLRHGQTCMVAELLYSTVGNRQSGTYSSNNHSISNQSLPASYTLSTHYRLHYLQIPLLFRKNFLLGQDKSTLFYLTGGVYMQTLFRARYTEYTNETLSENNKNVKNQFNPFDYGLAIGTGFNLPTDLGGRYLIEIRYTQGLTNAMKNKDAETILNSSLCLSMAYVFPAKKKSAPQLNTIKVRKSS
jgi:hypothetical protein